LIPAKRGFVSSADQDIKYQLAYIFAIHLGTSRNDMFFRIAEGTGEDEPKGIDRPNAILDFVTTAVTISTPTSSQG
jgi:hypothetical protein